MSAKIDPHCARLRREDAFSLSLLHREREIIHFSHTNVDNSQRTFCQKFSANFRFLIFKFTPLEIFLKLFLQKIFSYNKLVCP